MVDDPVEKVLTRLDNVKKSASGWMAKCPNRPIHDDQKASLSVGRGDRGDCILNCFAGCTNADILASIGLTVADLFVKGDRPDKGPSKIAAVYKYVDEAGKVLYEAVRFTPKDFKQRVPQPDGGYDWHLNGARRVLYRLPAILNSEPSKPVFVVEGEKDADALHGLGLVATTNVGGAGKWKAEYSLFLKGRHVVVLPDNDRPGRLHAVDVARLSQGEARSVRVVVLPGVPEKGDVSDWLAAGGTASQLLELARHTPHFDLADAERFVDPPKKYRTLRDHMNEPVVHVSWLVDELWKPGGCTLLGARSGVGKSTLARTASTQITNGGRFLRRACSKGPVVYCALEEDPRDVNDDFERMGADPDLVVPFYFDEMPQAGKEVDWLRGIIRDLHPSLVVIDTVVAFAHIKNINDYAEVTAKCGPIRDVFRNTGSHCLMLTHLAKPSKQEKEAGGVDMDDSEIIGSEAFKGVVDLIMLMKRDTKTNERWVATGKIRRAAPIEPSIVTMDYDTRLITLEGKVADVHLNRARLVVLDYLRVQPGATETMIKTGSGFKDGDGHERPLGFDSARVPYALRSLLDDGLIVREGQGVARNPYRYSLQP